VVDRAGLLVGKVDDVELSDEDPPRITALLLGPRALAGRLDGWLGRFVAGAAARLRAPGDPDPVRVPYDQVSTVDSAVHLRIRRDLLPEPSLEAWLRTHVVDRIPGADRADS
jgi:sporulation protein YlmC with PRC-barrel domain